MLEKRPAPAHNRSRDAHTEVTDHLKRNPGEWFKIASKDTQNAAANMAWKINNGLILAFRPEGDFDAYSTGKDVVARFVGGSDRG